MKEKFYLQDLSRGESQRQQALCRAEHPELRQQPMRLKMPQEEWERLLWELRDSEREQVDNWFDGLRSKQAERELEESEKNTHDRSINKLC